MCSSVNVVLGFPYNGTRIPFTTPHPTNSFCHYFFFFVVRLFCTALRSMYLPALYAAAVRLISLATDDLEFFLLARYLAGTPFSYLTLRLLLSFNFTLTFNYTFDFILKFTFNCGVKPFFSGKLQNLAEHIKVKGGVEGGAKGGECRAECGEGAAEGSRRRTRVQHGCARRHGLDHDHDELQQRRERPAVPAA